MLRSLHYQDPPIPVVLSCDLGEEHNGANVGLLFDYKSIVEEEATSFSCSREPFQQKKLGAEDARSRKDIRRAILKNVEVFEHRKEERIARTFGLTDERHPYVANFVSPGRASLCGGDLEILEEKVVRGDGMDKYRKTPSELRKKFEKHDAVFVFQLRNPIHNGHALLMKDTHKQLLDQGYKSPVLWINPLGGWTKDDDVPLKVRMEQHEALLQNNIFGMSYCSIDVNQMKLVFSGKTELSLIGELVVTRCLIDNDISYDIGPNLPVVLSIFPSPMLYAGPREVQWHALARQTVGATHYIVGRDPAGMKHPSTKEDIYAPWHGQTMLKMNPNFKMTIVPFQFAAYDKKAKEMAFFDKERKDDFVQSDNTISIFAACVATIATNLRLAPCPIK